MFQGEVIIYADGGCEGNGSQDARAFGSYILRAYRGDRLVKETRSGRLAFPQHHTNNAAELQIIIEALSVLQPGNYKVKVISDSKLAINTANSNLRACLEYRAGVSPG